MDREPPFDIWYRDHLFARSDLIKPKIKPDEIWESYYWWLCRINGFEFRKDRYSLTANIHASRRNSLFDELLAWFANLSREEFILNHTLSPLYRAVSAEIEITSFRSQAIRATSSFRHIPSGILYCPICMNCEIGTIGRPIWHRAHQIPGAYWCFSHPECALEMIINPLSQQPSTRKSVTSPSKRDLDHWKSSVRIQNFLAVCQLLLRRHRPFHQRRFEFAIYERAYRLGFSVKPRDSLPSLSLHISRIFPKAWLSSLKIKCDRSEVYSEVDPMLYHSSVCPERMIYPLLIATLWDDMNEALLHIESCNSQFAKAGFRKKGNWLKMQTRLSKLNQTSE